MPTAPTDRTPSTQLAPALAPHFAPHLAHWPPGVPHHLSLPGTHLFHNLEVSAARYPDKPCTVFFDTVLSYRDFKAEAEALAGHLQAVCGVQRGDRVLLVMQNSPQWAIGFYAILRADAVVVPVNPMNRTEELRHLLADSGAAVALVAQDLLDEMLPLHRSQPLGGLQHLVVATYSDHVISADGDPSSTDSVPDIVPDFVRAPRRVPAREGVVAWCDAIAGRHAPGPLQGHADDIAVLPYTSGTTGAPKGCVHSHRTVMANSVGGTVWFNRTQDASYLSALPFFHVTGLTGSMSGPIYLGATIVILPRWNREAAAAAVRRHRITTWQTITAMVVDFLANPALDVADLRSLSVIRGGGAAMPEAVAHRLHAEVGLDFIEGYGMTETMAATHLNPPQRPKAQCLGMPLFDVDSRVIDPVTGTEVPAGESGEIVVHGPQVMQGYWRDPQADAAAFIEIGGKRFLRTGDLGRVDEDGYFFMTDRLKRMINASGFKVWPAEVELLMFRNPAIQEACVISMKDAYRGESVKA
ncbi:MAG: long-chain-fatty-acid--CoA ligase, partial [Rubrivivax sp.]